MWINYSTCHYLYHFEVLNYGLHSYTVTLEHFPLEVELRGGNIIAINSQSELLLSRKNMGPATPSPGGTVLYIWVILAF